MNADDLEFTGSRQLDVASCHDLSLVLDDQLRRHAVEPTLLHHHIGSN